MGFAIYTYGGGEILWRVFNGIAMIFGSSTFMSSLMVTTLAIGTLWASTRSIYNNSLGIFTMQWVLPVVIALNVLFLPKTSVHIIDKVDSHFHYSKVDNVPLGLAAIPSLLSKISLFLTERIETVLTPAEELRYGQTGMNFASRLLARASETQIADPLMRENVKNFVSRCFLWPYVYSNCKGLKNEAKRTDDILGFIRDHPHSWLGTYWKNEDGSAAFVGCREAVPLVDRLMIVEAPKNIGRLAAKLFTWSPDEDREHRVVSARLERYMPDAWRSLTRETKAASEIVQQFIMLNIYFEAKDDHQQKSGLTRTFPHLTTLESQRAQAEQNIMGLIKGDIAGSWVPTLQAIFLSLLITLFILVLPMTFLPGGFGMLRTWVQLMVWVQTWPIFLSLLNAIGLIFFTKAVQAQLIHFGGVNILTHNALQETAYNAYTWIQGLQLSVPPLAWAVVSGSGYAISSLSSSLSGTLESVASRSASEVVDGNISFNNQSFGNRTAASASFGQQMIGAHMSFGETIDSGALLLTRDPTTGQIHSDHKVSNLNPNFQLNQALQGNLSESYLRAQTQATDQRYSYEQSLASTQQTAVQVGEMISKGRVYDETLSQSENLERQKSFERLNQAIDKYSAQTSVQDTTALRTEVYGELGLPNASGGILSAGAGMRAGLSQDSSDQTALSRLKDYGVTDQDMRRVSSSFSHISSSSYQAKDESARQLLKDYRASIDSTRSYQDQYQASMAKAQTLQTNLEYVRQSNIGSTINMNDYVLGSLAQSRFGGDVARASAWAAEHTAEFDAYGRQVMNSYVAKNFGHLSSVPVKPADLDRSSVQAHREIKEQASNLTSGQPLKTIADSAEASWAVDARNSLKSTPTRMEGEHSKEQRRVMRSMHSKIDRKEKVGEDLKERLKNVKG